MAVDLHTHSSRSDGSDPPARLVELAAAAGLSAVALMDHDTLDGIPEATNAAGRHGITLVSGTELSVVWPTGGMHLLAYFLHATGPLQDRLADLRAGRHRRNRRIVERLGEIGVGIEHDRVVEVAGNGAVGRPHIARVLMEGGHVATIAEAFDRYLARGRPAYVERDRLEAREAIRLVRASGGVPVVAHPHTIGVGADEYASAFEQLAGWGLGGIEAWYAEYSPEVRETLASIAGRLGLAATGGSDYHGTYKPGISLGTGRGDLRVEDAVLETLAAQR